VPSLSSPGFFFTLPLPHLRFRPFPAPLLCLPFALPTQSPSLVTALHLLLLLFCRPTCVSRLQRGLTPLILAAAKGHLAAVKALLDCDADIEARKTDVSGP
jgi:hypothetical protein